MSPSSEIPLGQIIVPHLFSRIYWIIQFPNNHNGPFPEDTAHCIIAAPGLSPPSQEAYSEQCLTRVALPQGTVLLLQVWRQIWRVRCAEEEQWIYVC